MCESMKDVLLDVIERKESLKIIYLGGSQPGAFRDISPISITGGKLRAKCHSSGRVKVFDIKKIQLPNDATIRSTPYGSVDNKIYETMQNVRDDFHALYPDGKWGVEFSDHSIELFDFFKNGKRKKTPFLAIYFMERDEEETITEMTFDATQLCVMVSERVRTVKTRPWVVSDQSGVSRSYSTLNKAAIAFFEKLSSIASGV